MYVMPCFLIVPDLQCRDTFGKIREFFGEIDPQLKDSNHPSNNRRTTSKKISWKHGHSLMSPRFYTERKDGVNTTSIWPLLTKKLVVQEGCFTDGDIDFFDIVARIMHGHSFILYVFIICLDYVLLRSIDKIL